MIRISFIDHNQSRIFECDSKSDVDRMNLDLLSVSRWQKEKEREGEGKKDR